MSKIRRSKKVYDLYVCPFCFRRINKCACETYPSWWLIMIDEQMQDIIRICNVDKGWKTGSCCESHFGGCPNLYISFGGFYELKEIEPPEGFKWDKKEVTVLFTNKEKQEDKFNEVKAEKLRLLREWVENLPIKKAKS